MQGIVLLVSVFVFLVLPSIYMLIFRTIRGARKKAALKKVAADGSASKTEVLHPTEDGAERIESKPFEMLATRSDLRQTKKSAIVALSRIDNLSPLKKAIIWAEILGAPGGVSEKERQ